MMPAGIRDRLWTVYALVEVRPRWDGRRSWRVRYIGRTTKSLDERRAEHRSSSFKDWFDEVIADKGEILCLPLSEDLETGLACQAEADWIATYDDGRLLNVQRPQAILIRTKPNLRLLAQRTS